MPRTPASLDVLVDQAIRPVVAEASAAIARALADRVASHLERELTAGVGARSVPAAPRRRARGARREEITRWVADRRARRVPNFVIQLTGLETKKQIVQRYGEAAFEKGKPAPKALR